MMRLMKKVFTLFSLALALTVLIKADVLAENQINGKYVSYTDEAIVNVKYAARYAQGSGGYSYINLMQGGSIANVKSSSSNLLAKVSNLSYSYNRRSVYDSEIHDMGVDETTTYSYAYIAYFAKRAGKYKVTFDILDENGNKVDTGSITVKTSGSSFSPIKKVTYAGKDIWSHNPYTTKKSGKFKVTMNKGYKVEKILVYNTPVYDVNKKVKNGAKINLLTNDYRKNDNDYCLSEYDVLFPETRIEVYYKNTKTKEVYYSSYWLRTINPKAMIQN